MNKFDKAMMETAIIWSKLSHCNRKKVGAVLSSTDNRILMQFHF
jgi:deoxycytidylate deaminase